MFYYFLSFDGREHKPIRSAGRYVRIWGLFFCSDGPGLMRCSPNNRLGGVRTGLFLLIRILVLGLLEQRAILGLLTFSFGLVLGRLECSSRS